MNTNSKRRQYEDVPAEPVKSFFVEMLTRDISLSDAILDLLDNSVDGILRKTDGRTDASSPYDGFYANIRYDAGSFEITDNCGGIPWELHNRAFRMGPADVERDRNIPTVGVYGIGMKRAIFKIGRNSLIQTQHEDDAYDVEISPQWLKDEDNWMIPVHASDSLMEEDGTSIVIDDLNPGVAALFGDDRATFEKELRAKISTHYAFIIDKGFQVVVNGSEVTPKPTELRFDETRAKKGIRPFIYETQIDGVNVFLAVGLTHPIPSAEDAEDETERKQYSSLDAGWTVVCNDRAVLYADRTELTGWGEAGVPKYHNQFIAISGIVEFWSNDSSLLPTTTTKRGIDASSRVYLQVKNKMREGMKMFTDFTNKWKGAELVRQAQEQIQALPGKSLPQLKRASSDLRMAAVSSGAKGQQYKPKLPMPKVKRTHARISFVKELSAIEDVARYLFGEESIAPKEVGERCFDRVLEEATE